MSRKFSRLLAVSVSCGALVVAVGPRATAAEPPPDTGNCVSFFTRAVADAGVAGTVISGGAHDLQPFGANIVRAQAHGALGDCPVAPPV
jgi:hypothetical protein